jgi:class 3 adenylate cyclase
VSGEANGLLSAVSFSLQEKVYAVLFRWQGLYSSFAACLWSFALHLLTLGALYLGRLHVAKALHFFNWYSATVLLSLALGEASGIPLFCVVVANVGCFLFNVHMGTPMRAVLLASLCAGTWCALHLVDSYALFLREDVSAEALARANEFVRPVVTVSTILFVCGFLFWTRQVNSEQENALRAEQLLVNKVVLGLLPAHTFERLKNGEELIADLRPSACVLFMDIVGFTQISEHFPPRQLVQGLTRLFADIEACVRRFPRVQKIKTVGDAFMCASGLVGESCEEDVVQMAELALALRGERFALRFVDVEGCFREVPIQFRIGIHLGEVVAGVVSRERFTFDVLGDTVNTASRMESTGLPNMIHVSDQFKQRVEHSFDFVDNGQNFVKGKGRLQTWFLAAAKSNVTLTSPTCGTLDRQ